MTKTELDKKVKPLPKPNWPPAFDDVVAENLERGLYLAQRDVLLRAIRDPQLSHRHRLVLGEIIWATNENKGYCFPGRKYLSEATGYPESTISTTIYELSKAGYILSERRAPEPGARAVAHYTIVKPTVEELQSAITSHIENLRRQKRPMKMSDFNPGVNVNPYPEFNPVVKHSTLSSTPVLRSTPPEFNHGVNVNPEASRACIYNNINNTSLEDTRDLMEESSSGKNLNIITGSEISTVANCAPVAATSKRKKRPVAPRARIPEDWVPTVANVQWVLERYAVSLRDIGLQAEKFRDHHRSLGTMIADLDATWRKWWGTGYHGFNRKVDPILPALFGGALLEPKREEINDADYAEIRRQDGIEFIPGKL